MAQECIVDFSIELFCFKYSSIITQSYLQRFALYLRIDKNSVAIERTEQNIESLNHALAEMETMPLGTIIAWNELDADSHPMNWVECDGRVIQG